MRQSLYISALLLFLSTWSYGQTEATYSQYMFNGLAINPAYAGSHEHLDLTALGRFQASGLEGAPSTQTFTAHSGFKQQKIGLGLLVTNDKVGVTQQTGFYFSYAYKIKFERSTLSLGLQGGGTLVDARFSTLTLRDPGDPLLSEDVNAFKPNFGAGAYYHSERFYAGLSMPQMLDVGDDRVTQLQPIIFTTGIVFPLNPAIMLKPNFLVQVVDQEPVEINVNLNTLIHEVLWVGFSYRPTNSFNTIIEIQITDQLRFGYAYDFYLDDLAQANTGAHEFMLNYQLRFNKKGVVNPRYF